MCANIFLFDEQMLPEYDTRDVGLSTSMALSMKLRCCVFNKVFLVNHRRDILNCRCKWLCLSNSYRCIGPKPCFCFSLNLRQCKLHLTDNIKLQHIGMLCCLFHGMFKTVLSYGIDCNLID